LQTVYFTGALDLRTFMHPPGVGGLCCYNFRIKSRAIQICFFDHSIHKSGMVCFMVVIRVKNFIAEREQAVVGERVSGNNRSHLTEAAIGL
jgi:hypothetical protein